MSVLPYMKCKLLRQSRPPRMGRTVRYSVTDIERYISASSITDVSDGAGLRVTSLPAAPTSKSDVTRSGK